MKRLDRVCCRYMTSQKLTCATNHMPRVSWLSTTFFRISHYGRTGTCCGTYPSERGPRALSLSRFQCETYGIVHPYPNSQNPLITIDCGGSSTLPLPEGSHWAPSACTSFGNQFEPTPLGRGCLASPQHGWNSLGILAERKISKGGTLPGSRSAVFESSPLSWVWEISPVQRQTVVVNGLVRGRNMSNPASTIETN